MNLKLSILSFCIVATAARKQQHHIRSNSDDDHQLGFHATEHALHRLLEQQSLRAKEDAEELLSLRGSGRFLKDVYCDEVNHPGITCDKDTEECDTTTTPPECNVVCDPYVDCNGNGKCKNGECECYERFDGDACDKCAKGYYKYKDDCRYKDVDVEYEFEFEVATEDEEDCAELIDDLQLQLDALADGLPDEARVKVSGSRKSRRLKSHSRSELLVTIEVPVVECNQTAVVNAAIEAVQDVSAPTGATFLSRKSRGSRD
ncbi:hypothetical protein ACHAWT_000224 [Skeletonema menzelii]